MENNYRARLMMLALVFTLFGLGYAPCQAQGIVGKWKIADVKAVATEKATGKKEDISSQLAPMYKEMQKSLEFRADHTMIFSATLPGSAKVLSLPGTYELSEDKLTMDTELNKKLKAAGKDLKPDADDLTKLPKFVTVKFNGGNMIFQYSADMTEEGKTFHFDLETIYQRQ